MKLNQKILKAINEGIRKSLLSFDDVEFDKTSSTNTNQKIVKTTKDQQWIQENFIDLGLPSGTLWCKWNVGATNGDTLESWYGDYYAWGETKIKSKYTTKNYTYKESTKILPNDNDIAYFVNNLMHMPSKEQVEELMILPNKWIFNYNGISGLNGRIFKGTNDNELFIPAAGFYNNTHLYNDGYCYLWTNSHGVDSSYSWCFNFSWSGVYMSEGIRYFGFSTRGVIN